MQTSSLLFSVVVPSYSRPAQLALCLQRLVPGVQRIAESKYEVIVTDDSPDDATAQRVTEEFPWVRYTRGPRRGPAANRNNGARLAKGEWLVFTDDDCLPETDWLQAYAKAIAMHPQSKAFEGAILPDDWALLKKDMAECPVNTEGGCFWSANIMVKKELFEKVGGFDEQFLIAAQEDQDLQWRLQQHTHVVFVKEAKVAHPVRFKSFRKSIRECCMRAINHQKFAEKLACARRESFDERLHCKASIKFQTHVLLQQLKRFHIGHATIAFVTIFRCYLPQLLKLYLR